MSNYYGYPNGYGQTPQQQAWMAAAAYPSYSAAPQAYSDAYKAMQQASLANHHHQQHQQQQQQAKMTQSQSTSFDYTQYTASSGYYANNAASASNAYDTAIYSAAGMLMSQRAPTWPVAPLPVPPPPPPPPPPPLSQDLKKVPFKRRMATSNMQVFYCETCKISCAGPSTYKEHLEGQKHKKREVLVNKVDTKKTNQYQIHCDLCEVTCTGKDAYLAHIRGSKHQKTIKLHQKLGKPIPDVQSVLSKAQSNGVTISAPPVMISKTPITHCKFVPGSSLHTLAVENEQTIQKDNSFNVEQGAQEEREVSMEDEEQQDQQNAVDFEIEPDVEPVGREYIETKNEGKIVIFYCKLCDCKFNDPNAKEMHLKGRRHRLAYKKKVDPSLKVDIKSNGISKKMNTLREKREKMRQKLEERRVRAQAVQHQVTQSNRNESSHDDRHIMAKHTSIYPTTDEINIIQELVTSCEKALKLVSDEIAAEELSKTGTVNDTQKESPPVIRPLLSIQLDAPSQVQQQQQHASNRILKGVMRVGLLAKGLLLHGDSEVQLVVLCTNKPTKSLFNRVHSSLSLKLPLVTQTPYTIVKDIIEECIHVKTTQEPIINCRIYMTSPVCRQENQTIESTIKQEPLDDSDDLLDKVKCLESLAALRHVKWFQATASTLPNCVIIIRILRDLRRRNPTWRQLSQWALELLAERSVASSMTPCSPGEALRRILECISSGILLEDGPGLYDPCESTQTDAIEYLKPQQREDITSSAQMALRLLAFKEIHRILGMDLLVPMSRLPIKRHMSESTPSNVDEKRERLDAQQQQQEQEQQQPQTTLMSS